MTLTPEQQDNEVLAYTRAEVAKVLRAAVTWAIRSEREACAKVCDAEEAEMRRAYEPDAMYTAVKLAAAIRART